MRRAPLRRARGFSLVELSVALAIMAILSAIAMPVYRDHLERAHLAGVLVQYDAMREKAAIVAAEAGADLCAWTAVFAKGSSVPDASTLAVQKAVEDGIAALPHDRWKPGFSQFVGAGVSQASGPLVVQFGGVGPEGVRRVRLLAEQMKSMGVFQQWTRDLPVLATFTAHLGSCGSTGVAGGAGAGTGTGTSGGGAAATPGLVVATTNSGLPATVPPACGVTQQLSADQTRCEPKTCAPNQVLDNASGRCVASGPQPEKVFHFPDNPAGASPGQPSYCKVDASDPHNTGVRFGDACHPPCKVQPTDAQPTGFIVDGQCMPLGGGRTLADTFPTPAPDPRWGGIAANSRFCFQCKPDGSEYCEYEYDATTCDAPANYCVNRMQNQGGTARVVRRCGSIEDVYQVWSGKGNTSASCARVGAAGSAGDIDDGATCTYVCLTDRCNQDLSDPALGYAARAPGAASVR